MPKKKKVDDMHLTFTGKMVIIVELEEFGPMEFTIDDKDMVLDVMKVILGVSNNFSVNSYSKRDEKTLKKLLEKPNEISD